MIPSVVLVDLGAQVFKTTIANWTVSPWAVKLNNYLNPDYWLFKDTEHYCWPWPKSSNLQEIEFRIALNKVRASSAALEKSIQNWNNLQQGVNK